MTVNLQLTGLAPGTHPYAQVTLVAVATSETAIYRLSITKEGTDLGSCKSTGLGTTAVTTVCTDKRVLVGSIHTFSAIGYSAGGGFDSDSYLLDLRMPTEPESVTAAGMISEGRTVLLRAVTPLPAPPPGIPRAARSGPVERQG